MNRKRIKELAADAELGIFQETSIIGRRARIEAAILAALEDAFSEEASNEMVCNTWLDAARTRNSPFHRSDIQQIYKAMCAEKRKQWR